MKPVAWRVWNRMGGISLSFKKPDASEYVEYDPLYTAPRELSDEEIHDIWKSQWEGGNIGHIAYTYARAILKKASE
jgi:hypothetical protein